MRERDVERYLVERVRAAGGEVRKVQWIGRRGAPDRVVFLNGAHFIELKRPGETPQEHQWREIEKLRDHQASVMVIDSTTGVDLLIHRLVGTLH